MTGRIPAKAAADAIPLRGRPRRALKVAHAINDEKASKFLEAYAAELLARADIIEGQGEN